MDIDPNEPPDDAVYLYYAKRRRRLAVQPYDVLESIELRCPPNVAAGYAELKDEFARGIDVNPRLSRRLSKPTCEDPLLNDWGITHLHLGLRDGDGAVPRTGPLLFAHVRGAVVRCVGIYVHGAWAKQEMLEILQRNWPETMERARADRVTGFEDLSDADKAKLRKGRTNILTTVNGLVYGPVGGGYTAAGTSMDAHWEADRAIIKLEEYERYVRENIDAIIELVEAHGSRISAAPWFRFAFDDAGQAVAVEVTTGLHVMLGYFPD